MVSIITRAPAGFPGAITRSDSCTVEQEIIDSAVPPTRFGGVVKMVAGKLRGIAAGDASAACAGFLVRSFPTQSASNDLGVATPPTSGIADRLRRGFVAVPLAQGVAAKEGQVYVRTTADGGKLVGDIETAADGGACVAVTGALFTGPADAGGIVEVAYKI